jgi:hypothetical protein
MTFDLAGRVILQDAFSATLNLLTQKSTEAEKALGGLGTATEAPVQTAKKHIADLKTQIEQLQAKAKSGAPITVGDLSSFKDASSVMKQTQADLDELNGVSGESKLNFQALMNASFMLAPALALVGSVASVISLAKVGDQAINAQTAFENLSASAKISGADLVASMSAAARGTLDDSDIMLRANRMLLSGNANLLKYLPELYAGVRVAALATGRDVNEVFGQVQEGVLKANVRLIAQAGIFMRSTDVLNEYAAAHGKVASSLTMEERQAAVAEAAIKSLASIQQRAGLDATTASEKMDTLKVSLDQLKEMTGKYLIDIQIPDKLAGLAGWITGAVAVQDRLAGMRTEIDALNKAGQKDDALKLIGELNNITLAGNFAIDARTLNPALDELAVKLKAVQVAATQAKQASMTGTYMTGMQGIADESTAAATGFGLYTDAVSAAVAASTGLEGVANTLAGITAQIDTLTSGIPQLPALTGSLLSFTPSSVAAIKAYAAAMAELNPENAKAVADVNAHVASLQAEQIALLHETDTMGDKKKALDMIAQAYIGPTASAKDLLAQYGQMPQFIQNIVSSLMGYTAALQISQEVAKQPVPPITNAILSNIGDVTDKAAALKAIIADVVGQGAGFSELNKKFADLPVVVQNGVLKLYDLQTAIKQVQDQAKQPLDLNMTLLLQNLDQLRAMGPGALKLLAQAALGGSSDVMDLVQNYQKLPPEVQAAADKLGLFSNAVAYLKNQAAGGVTVDVSVNGLDAALQEIDRMSLSLAGIMDPAAIRQFNYNARQEATAHWNSMGQIDKFGMDLEKATILGGLQDIVTATVNNHKTLEQEAANHYTNLATSATELTGKITTALKSGSEVTAADMLASQAGTYQDAALESAKRLQAVAERGFAEIKAHPDWAAALKIPPEVLAGTDIGLKAWAAKTKIDVTDLARPDLIDWPAFIRQMEDQLNREAAQGITIDRAVVELKSAGLLQGMSEEERKKKVAKLMGIEDPSITIESLFKDTTKKGDLVTQYLAGKSAEEVPAKLVYKTSGNNYYNPETGQYQETPYVAPPQTTPTAPPSINVGPVAGITGGVLDPVAMQASAQAAMAKVDGNVVAAPLGASIAAGLTSAMADPSIGLTAAAQLQTAFKTADAQWLATGTYVGGRIMAGVSEACKQGSQEIIQTIATAVSPAVASMLARIGPVRSLDPSCN